MKKYLFLAAAALSLGGALPAYANEAATPAAAASTASAPRYTFDKAHTQIFFTVNHAGFSNSSGKFLEFDGGFNLDKQKPENSSVDVVIKTASINMDDTPWDDHLKGKDFFNVEKFPEMTFKSTKVELTGEKTANVTGDLTILGVTKPITLAVILNKAEVHPYIGKEAAGFSITGSLKRSDFGMTYGLPAVGDDVQLRIEVEGVVADEKTTNE